MSIPKIEKKYSFIATPFGLSLAIKVFNVDEKYLEKLVWRYQSGKRVGQLRGKITWWRIISGGFINGMVIKEKGAQFGFRITDYTEEKIYLGSPIINKSEPEWLDDYKDWIESKLTNEEKVIRQQKTYIDKKTTLANKMIEKYISTPENDSNVEKFAMTIIESNKFSEDSKKFLIQEVSKWCFKNKKHEFAENIRKSYLLTCSRITDIDKQSTTDILNNKEKG
jgi:hypothetical protein